MTIPEEWVKDVDLSRLFCLCLPVFLFLCLHSPSFGAGNSDGWSEDAARAMIGKTVACVRTPHEPILKWGPRFRGWHRDKQPKATGRPLDVGATGKVSEILQVSKGLYKVVVHWDSEEKPNTYWTTVIGPQEYGIYIVDT